MKEATFRLNGIISEPPGFAVPPTAWTAGSNMLARAGVMTRIPFSVAVTPTGVVRPWIAQEVDHKDFLNSTTSPTFYGGGTYAAGSLIPLVHTLNGGKTASTNVTPGSWSGASTAMQVWSACRLNAGCYVLNYSREVPVYYNALTATCAVVPNWLGANYRALVVRSFREFLFALDVFNGASYELDSVYWSDRATGVAVPATWIAAAGNLAGSATLQGGGGRILDGLPLGDALFIYKRNAVWRADRVDDNAIFGFREVFTGLGARGPNCVASDGRYHYVLTDRDIIRHDGGSYESLLSEHNRGLIDPMTIGANDKRNHSIVFFDPGRLELHAYWPTGANYFWASSGVVINTVSGAVSARTPPGGLAASMWYEGDVGGQVYSCDASGTRFVTWEAGGTDDAGAAITTSLTRSGLDLGSAEQRKVVHWIRPRIKQLGAAFTMTCEVAMTETPDDTPTYGASVSFATATAERAWFTQQTGRYLAVRLTTSGAEEFSIEGFDVGYEIVGGH